MICFVSVIFILKKLSFPPSSLISSTNKTDHHDIVESCVNYVMENTLRL